MIYRSTIGGAVSLGDDKGEVALVMDQRIDSARWSTDEIAYLVDRGFIVAENTDDEKPKRTRTTK